MNESSYLLLSHLNILICSVQLEYMLASVSLKFMLPLLHIFVHFVQLEHKLVNRSS